MSNSETGRPNHSRWTWTMMIAGGLLLAALLVHPAVPRFIRDQLPSSIDLRGFGYFAHAAAYALLTLILLLLLHPRNMSSTMVLVGAAALHGLLTESAQFWIPARDCDPLDLLANLGGIVVSTSVYAGAFGRLMLRRNSGIEIR